MKETETGEMTTGTMGGGAIRASDFSQPDETRNFPKGSVRIARLGGVTAGMGRFEPGWKWSECVKPIAQTEWCEAPHALYCLSGAMEITMRDGARRTVKAGEAAMIPPGHDAKVIGGDVCMMVDFGGLESYALPPTRH